MDNCLPFISSNQSSPSPNLQNPLPSTDRIQPLQVVEPEVGKKYSSGRIGTALAEFEDKILALPKHDFVHPNYGTKMSMLNDKVPATLKLDDREL